MYYISVYIIDIPILHVYITIYCR